MVSKGQFVGLNWNRITRLHSQVMYTTHKIRGALNLTKLTKVYGCYLVQTFNFTFL